MFLASFLQYVIVLVFLVLVAFCGGFVGKKLRDRKDAKTISQMTDEKEKNKEDCFYTMPAFHANRIRTGIDKDFGGNNQ